MRSGVRLKGIKVVNKPNGRRHVYRRVSGKLVPLPDLPENDPKFLAAYAAAEKVPQTAAKPAAGTIAELCDRYIQSREFAALSDSTRPVRRRVVQKIRDERGTGKLADLRTDHIRKDVRALTPGAASNRLKAWRGIFSFAVDEGMMQSDPSRNVKVPRGSGPGHRQWTLPEIEKFRAHWPDGSKQRVAFEVIYWTAARCSDAARLGSQMVDSQGWLHFTQVKTNGKVALPLHCTLPAWAASMKPDQAHLRRNLPDALHWITTSTGKPRSVKGLSQWVSAAAAQAGLPADCTAHGLRKARAAALAEAGATPHQIGAWTGHSSLSEVAHYTRQADLQRIIAGPEQD
jgi:site-specific recombinase XerD